MTTGEKHEQQPTRAMPEQFVPSTGEVRDYSVFTSSMRKYLSYLLGFIIILSTLTATIYFPLIPLLSQELKVSIQAINLTVTLYAVCQGVTPPLFASLADTFGRRPVLLGLVALYACASLGLALSRNSYSVLLALRALQSIGGSATPAIAYGIVADVAVVSERGGMLGPMQSFCNGAYAWIFLALFIVAVVCLALIGFTLPETARNIVDDGSLTPPKISKLWCTDALIQKYGMSSTSSPGFGRGEYPRRPKWRPIMLLQSLRLIFYPDAAAVLWVIATSYCVYYTFQVAIPVIYQDLYGYSDFEVGLTFLPGLVGMTIGGIIAGKLLDRNFAIIARSRNFPIDQSFASYSPPECETRL
ncbi:hypothetical protein PG994_002702 [Apiospora phragmitis]|uniref:Major facilitator superfamily (MFS) profile domain-containing protein n=1 Tax=Apiospora phragmitis TaxID=2905665 RepID=A0ABR1W5W9_9PEZI